MIDVLKLNAAEPDCLAMLLKLDGHEVHAVYGAAAALEAAGRLKPEMGFLDIGLPVMDGYEVARQLRSCNGHEPLRLIDRPHRFMARREIDNARRSQASTSVWSSR